MESTQVTLHEGAEAWYVEALMSALKKAAITFERSDLEAGGQRITVAQADVARAAAVLAGLGEVSKPWSANRVFLVGGLVLVPSSLLVAVGLSGPNPTTSSAVVWGLFAVTAAQALNKLTLPRSNPFAGLAWLFVALATAIGFFTGHLNAVAGPFPRMLSGTLGVSAAVLALGLTIAGFVSHLRFPGRYQRGLGELFGAGVVLMIFTASFLVAFKGGRSTPLAPFDATPVVMTEKNFRLTPVAPFRKIDLSKVSPDATLSFVYPGSSKDEAYAVLIAEVLPTELTPEALVDFQRQRLEARGPVVMEGPKPANLGGGAGLEAHFTARLGKLELQYVMWVYSRNGYAYQWLAWGSVDAPLRERVLPLIQRFEILDLEKRAPGVEPPGPPLAFDSRGYGYSGVLPAPWGAPDAATREQFAGTDFTAACSGQAWFAVAPFVLLPQQVDDALVLEAMARTFITDEEAVTTTPLKLEAPFRGERRTRVVSDRTTTLDLVLSDGLGFILYEERTNNAVACPSALAEVKLAPVLRADLKKARAVGWLPAFYGLLSDVAREAKQDAVSLSALQEQFVHAPNRDNAHSLAKEAARLKEASAVLQFLEARAEGKPTSPMRGAQALVLAQSGREREAVAVFKKWFDAGFAEDLWLLEYVWALEAAGQRKEALARVASYRKAHDSVLAIIVHAFLMQRAGQAKSGLALLQTELEKRRDPELLDSVMQLLNDLEQEQASLAAFAKWSDRGISPTADILVEKARSELGLDRVAAAKQTVDRALRLEPQHVEARALFESVKSWLGEGRNEALSEPIAAVALPPLPTARPATAENKEPAFYELRGTAISFVPGRELRQTTYLHAKVNDRDGVEMFSTLRFSFDPRYEHLFLNSLVVKDAQGKLVGAGTMSSMYLSDDADDERGTNQRTAFLPVPGLQVGYSLEAVVSRAAMKPPQELDFDVHHFAASLPTRLSVFSLVGELTQVRSHESHLGADGKQEQPGGWWWSLADPPRVKHEPFSPHGDEFLPTLTYGPVAEWEKLGLGYLGQVRTLVEPDGATATLARTAVTKARTDEERVAALTAWVREHVTYKAIEFGRGARIPRPAPEVATRGYGDCKDQSLLLLKLLRSSSIDAELVLIRSGGPIEKSVASLDQFDHMVLWVGGKWFIDPTAEAPDAFRSASYLAGQQALVLDQHPHFIEVPRTGLEQLLSIERTVRLVGRDAVVNEDVTVDGFMAAALRREVLGAQPSQRLEALQPWLGSLARVTSVAEAGAKSTSGPLTLRLEYRLANALRETDGALIGQLPAEWELSRINVGKPGNERLSPVRVRFPIKLTSTTRLIAPRGFQLSLPREGKGTSPFATWELKASADVVRFQYQRLPAEAEAGAFTAFVAAHDELTESLRQPLMLRPIEASVRVGPAEPGEK